MSFENFNIGFPILHSIDNLISHSKVWVKLAKSMNVVIARLEKLLVHLLSPEYLAHFTKVYWIIFSENNFLEWKFSVTGNKFKQFKSNWTQLIKKKNFCNVNKFYLRTFCSLNSNETWKSWFFNIFIAKPCN